MKKAITTLAILLFSVITMAQTERIISSIPNDKVYHGIAGVGISSSVFFLGQHTKRKMVPWAPTLATITVAYTKELVDEFKGTRFSMNDFFWTSISGAAANIVLHYAFDKDVRQKRKAKRKSKKEIEFKEDFPLVKRAE